MITFMVLAPTQLMYNSPGEKGSHLEEKGENTMAFRFEAAFVTISAFNLEEITQFYRQFFQQEPIGAKPHSYVEFYVANLCLGIFRPHESSKEEFARVGKNPMSICLEVSDLDEAIARITALGYAPPGGVIHTPHGREVYAYDPEQNRLILHQSWS
jgi:predicted enzyme related to lactoylglutathione lyase